MIMKVKMRKCHAGERLLNVVIEKWIFSEMIADLSEVSLIHFVEK